MRAHGGQPWSTAFRRLLPRGRVLGINVPLDLLRPAADDAARSAWLARLLARRPRRCAGPSLVDDAAAARRYDEPLTIYDRTVQPFAP